MQNVANILLATHNARMRCFLEDTIKEKMDAYRAYANMKEIRFKNAAVLLLKIENGIPTLSLVYEGTVNKPKKGAYFTTEQSYYDASNGINYIHFDDIRPQLNLRLTKNINYNIFMVRHGEAYHNTVSLNIYRDTDLTKDGEQQGILAGQFFRSQNINFDYYFSSYLKRTRETINSILEGMGKTENYKQIVVLPCAHELGYNIQDSCDAAAEGKPKPPENIMYCSGKNVACNTIDYCCTTPSIGIDWSYYQEFYNLGRKCRDTNMIQELVSYVENNPPRTDVQIAEYIARRAQYGGYYNSEYHKYKKRYLNLKKQMQK